MDDPLGTFSQISLNDLHVEDVRSYIHCKFERIGDNEIQQELSEVLNGNLNLKPKFAHLLDLNLVKCMFYKKFDNHDQSQNILSQVHEEIFWVGDSPILIDNELIHKVKNEGFNPINEKNMKELVEETLKTNSLIIFQSIRVSYFQAKTLEIRISPLNSLSTLKIS